MKIYISLYIFPLLLVGYNIFMNFIAKLARSSLLRPIRSSFASDNWKDRDQSAEKVYISNEESNPLII